MKKLFVAALAVLGFAACSNDEVLDAPRSSAITFDNAIIDNATRAAAADPSTDSNTIENFEVWAFIDRYTGVVFEDENVEKKGSAWVHENAQYWTPNHTYYFAALSPMDSKNVNDLTLATDKATLGLGSFTFTNEDGSEDLLYAKEQVVTGANVSGVQNPVSLKFQHLLSKVKFTFSNGFPTNKTSVVVSEIKMSAPKSATIDLAQADYSNAWVLGNESFNLEFGDLLETLQAKAKAESALERLTIPASADQVYEISFRVQLYYGDVLAHDVVKTSTVSGIALEMGNAYNFQAEITPDNLELQPIEFAVSVDKWIPENGYHNEETVAGVPVTSSDELTSALNSGAERVVLTSAEYTLPTSLGASQTKISITGNGIENTTVNGGTTANSNHPGVYAYGKHLVFKDLTYVTPNNGYQGGFGHAASVTFINCKIVGQFYAHSGAPHTFTECIIDPLTGYLYTYASDCVFEGCTFESSEGKALQVYEDAANGENTVVIKDCTFKAAKVAYTWDNKPVTPIDINSNGAIFNVTVENCTATGYGVGMNSNSDLWNIKNNAQCVNLTVDGEMFSIEGYGIVNGYYAIGNTYTVLTAAGFREVATTVLADGNNNVTIELANDIDLAGIEWPAVATKAAFVLDGKGHSIKNLTASAVEDHGFYSTALFTSTRKATVIKNLVVENATVTGKGGDNSHGAVLVACNYNSLSIEGVTVKNSTVSNCDRTAGLVTYLYFTNATVKDCVVEGCTINSIGTAGAVLGMNNSHNFTMTGCRVDNTTVSSSEGNNKAGILIGTWQKAGTLTSEGNTTSSSKAINAGVETNNEIGRQV